MAEHDQRFDTFTQWVNKASSWLTRRGPHEKAICLDAKNRVCRNGGDMQRARDEDAFPVRWLWPDDVADLQAGKAQVGDALSEDDLRAAIHAWIAKDAPVTVKMTMTPVLVQALVNRIAH